MSTPIQEIKAKLAEIADDANNLLSKIFALNESLEGYGVVADDPPAEVASSTEAAESVETGDAADL